MTGEGKRKRADMKFVLWRGIEKEAQKDDNMLRENARDTSEIHNNPVFPFTLSEILTNAINSPELKNSGKLKISINSHGIMKWKINPP